MRKAKLDLNSYGTACAGTGQYTNTPKCLSTMPHTIIYAFLFQAENLGRLQLSFCY